MGKEADKSGIPLYEFEARCPVCDKLAIQRQLKDDAITVIKRDMDLRPIIYEWKNPEFKKFIPLIFYIQRCPHCNFSASKEYFKNPSADLTCSNNNFRKRITTNLAEDEGFRQVVDILATKRDGESLYFFAIKKFLTAIRFLQALKSVEEQDSLPLAKYCLHLSYLYKELEASNIWQTIKQHNDQLKFDLIQTWNDAPLTGVLALQKALYYYDLTYYNSPIPKRKNFEPQLLQMIGRLHVVDGDIIEGRKVLLKAVQEANMLETDPNSDSLSNYEEFVAETQEILLQAKVLLSAQQAVEKASEDQKMQEAMERAKRLSFDDADDVGSLD